jgi:hypothetical protein
MHLTEPGRGILGFPVECQLLRVLHEVVGDHKRQWRTHSHALGLFVDVAIEIDELGGQKKKDFAKLNIIF